MIEIRAAWALAWRRIRRVEDHWPLRGGEAIPARLRHAAIAAMAARGHCREDPLIRARERRYHEADRMARRRMHGRLCPECDNPENGSHLRSCIRIG